MQEWDGRCNWVHYKSEQGKWLVVHIKDATDEPDLYELSDSDSQLDVSVSLDLSDEESDQRKLPLQKNHPSRLPILRNRDAAKNVSPDWCLHQTKRTATPTPQGPRRRRR